MENGNVLLDIKDKIGTITFFHPQSNSLPENLLNKLTDTITECGNNDDVNIIILKSEGERVFCAGASFDRLITINDKKAGHDFFMGFANVINSIRKCPRLIIGRVQGKAVGGGVGLASAVDYCLATKFASIKLSELAIGIGPFVVSPVVERKIGISAMSQLAINATEWKTANWAKQKGLYAEVFDDIETLDKAVYLLATKLANSNPEAMRLLKKIFWEGTEHWVDLLPKRAAISGELVLSDFTRNAIEKFKSR